MSPWLIAVLVLGVTAASVVVMIAVWRAEWGLILVWFLDHPYTASSGSIEPIEMQRAITLIQSENPDVDPRCDATGA